MSNWGAGLNGFATGISNGMALGKQIRGALDDYSLQKVREQGIAEAQAAAAAAAPTLTDNGEQPQMSADPNAQPEPINTSLDALISNAKQAQDDPVAAARGDGIKTSAVDAPEQPEPVGEMSTPKLAPGTRADGSTFAQAASVPDVSNFDAAAKAGGPPLAKPKRFNVDGQEFDDEDAARAYISKHTPQAESFYKDTLVPKMKARLLELGRDKEAEAWQDYADKDQTRENFKTWDRARRLADFGDHNGAAEELFKLHPHYADGYTLKGAERTKGPDGSDGFTMTVADKDGNEQKIYQNSETITRMGVPLLHPIEAFKTEYEALNKVDQARAKEAVDIRDDNRRASRESANLAQRDADMLARTKAAAEAAAGRQKVRGEQAQSLEQTKQVGREALTDKKLDAAVQAAATKASQVGAGGYRKGKSPDEWMASAVLDLASKDPTWSMKTPEQKQQAKDALWKLMPDSIRNGVGKPASEVAYARGIPNSVGKKAVTAPAAPTVPQASLSSQPPDMPGAAPAPAASVAPPAGMKPRWNPATGLVEMVPR